MKSRSRLNSDTVGGAVMLAVGAFAAYEAAKLPFGTLHQPDSGFFPLCVAVLLMVFALATLLPAVNASHADSIAGGKPSWSVAILVVGLVLYTILLTPVGFLLSTFALVFAMLRTFGKLRSSLSLLIAVPSVVVCYLLFTRLGVPLPAGIAGF